MERMVSTVPINIKTGAVYSTSTGESVRVSGKIPTVHVTDDAGDIHGPFSTITEVRRCIGAILNIPCPVFAQ